MNDMVADARWLTGPELHGVSNMCNNTLLEIVSGIDVHVPTLVSWDVCVGSFRSVSGRLAQVVRSSSRIVPAQHQRRVRGE